MPGMIPFLDNNSGNGVPSLALVRKVSSNKITPLIASSIPLVVNSISR
jgi:hypothetical protein